MFKKKILWPIPCKWPEPVEDFYAYDYTEFLNLKLDKNREYLVEVKEYYDELVEQGILKEDYSVVDYEANFYPSTGEDYWDGFGFRFLEWEEDFNYNVNMIKIYDLPIDQDLIGYEFINENLLRQAFTRRSFSVENHLDGCSEELEFLGDSLLSSIVTREIIQEFSVYDEEDTYSPFTASYKEGEMSRLRTKFTNKEYLASRCKELGLDQYILYGKNEKPSDNAYEDLIEAIIGAVAIDSNYDQKSLEDVVYALIDMHLEKVDQYLKRSYYEIFNSWHQKHFGRIPEYYVWTKEGNFFCEIEFYMPDCPLKQSITSRYGFTRSDAKNTAAELAYFHVINEGYWMRLDDVNIEPDFDKSINQLQELYQKKYIEQPKYEIYDNGKDWECVCTVNSFVIHGKGKSKTMAKKKASYVMLVRILGSAGIMKKEWFEKAYLQE